MSCTWQWKCLPEWERTQYFEDFMAYATNFWCSMFNVIYKLSILESQLYYICMLPNKDNIDNYWKCLVSISFCCQSVISTVSMFQVIFSCPCKSSCQILMHIFCYRLVPKSVNKSTRNSEQNSKVFLAISYIKDNKRQNTMLPERNIPALLVWWLGGTMYYLI
jgi:hypothetical protein